MLVLNRYHEGLNRNLSYLCSSTFPHTKQSHVRRHCSLRLCDAPCHSQHEPHISTCRWCFSSQQSESPRESTKKPRQAKCQSFRCTSKWVHSWEACSWAWGVTPRVTTKMMVPWLPQPSALPQMLSAALT